MVKPAYLAIGGVVVAAAAWWYLRGKVKPTDTAQKPISLDITMPNQSSGGGSSLSLIDQLLNTANLLPVESVLPNSAGPVTAVSPGVVAPVASSGGGGGGGQSYPEPAPGPGIEELRRQAVEAKANGGLSGTDYLFSPVVQAYSSDFAAHNTSGGGFDFVKAVGGLDGYIAGNRA